MLNKQQVIEALLKFINEFNVPASDIAILAGSALVLRDLRETCSDIDMSIPTEQCVRLSDLKEFVTTVPRFPGHMRIEYDCYDVGNNKFPHSPVGDYNVQTLESLLELKQNMNREKDQDDILNLKKALSV